MFGISKLRKSKKKQDVNPHKRVVEMPTGREREPNPKVNPVQERLSRIKEQGTARRRLGFSRPKLAFWRRRAQEPSANSAERLLSQRKIEQRQRKVSELNFKIRDRAKLIMTALIVVVVLALVGAGILYLHQQGTFVLEKMSVSGNMQVSNLEIVAELEDLKGRGMFSFSTAEVEDRLRTRFPYLKYVYARKRLPGEIEVEVVERFPVMSYVNLSGVYLIDEESVVVNALVAQEVTPLTNSERLVVDGFGDPNASYVYERYLAGIENEQERAGVNWDEVLEEVKRNALDSLRAELDIRVNKLIGDNLALLATSQFSDLPKVLALDAELWEIGQPMAADRYEYSIAIINYLTESGLQIIKLQWQSDFTAVVDLSDGRQVMFTSTRDIQEQIAKLEVVRSRVDLNGVTVIDLRGEFVAVK